jgi:hypothetical protein
VDIVDEEQAWRSVDHVILFISEYSISRKPVVGDFETTQFFLILRRGVVSNGVTTYTLVGVGFTDREFFLEISPEHGWKEERMRLL